MYVYVSMYSYIDTYIYIDNVNAGVGAREIYREYLFTGCNSRLSSAGMLTESWLCMAS